MIMKTYIPFFVLCILISCSTPHQKKISLEQALSFAGENRIELEKVFEHYKNDSLKLKAAEYLITNMPLHFPESNTTYRRKVNNIYRILLAFRIRKL